MNYQDIISLSVEKGVLFVRGISQGYTVLEISSPSVPHKFFFKFYVGGAIHPFAPKVHVGDQIDFTVTSQFMVNGTSFGTMEQLTSISKENGIWDTEDHSIMT